MCGGHGGFGGCGCGGGAQIVTVTVCVVLRVTVRTGPATVLVEPRTVTVLVAPATVRVTTRPGSTCVLPETRRTTIRRGSLTVFSGTVTVAAGAVVPGNVSACVVVRTFQKARCSRSPTPTWIPAAKTPTSAK